MKRALLAFLMTVGCSSASNGRNNSSTGTTGGHQDGGGEHFDDLAVNQDAFFINDPPPMYCGLDGGSFTQPSPPGGTLDCPDDKNLPGCPCPTVGMTAACWPGLRANRGLGICKDGMTTCTQLSETVAGWGPCQGAVLPIPNATDGAGACRCFSHGLWNIENVSPCLVGNGTTTTMAWSTSPAPSPQPPGCSGTPPAAGTIWSTDQVTADCEGTFTLCFTIKAFTKLTPSPTPQAGDCVISQTCVKSDYTQVNMPQNWPSLPSWVAPGSASSCVMQFATTGGYAEMSVKGETVTCDMIPDHVFQTVTYCAQGQANCSPGGGGQF
jgi:hypothetical protein